MPAYSEMIPLLGVRSKSVVHFWMRKLLKEGVLEKDRKGLLRTVRRDFALLPSAPSGRVPVALRGGAAGPRIDRSIPRDEAESILPAGVSGDSMTGEGGRVGRFGDRQSGEGSPGRATWVSPRWTAGGP